MTSARRALVRTPPRQPAPGQFSLASCSTNGLQPSFDSIQARAYASSLELVEQLPSPFVRLWLACCSWQYSRREILEAKSPSLSSTVNVERRGQQGEQYIDRRRRVVQWTERFAPKSAPITHLIEVWRVCASAVGLPLYWAILRFTGQRIWLARLRRLFQCRSVCNATDTIECLSAAVSRGHRLVVGAKGHKGLCPSESNWVKVSLGRTANAPNRSPSASRAKGLQSNRQEQKCRKPLLE